MITILFRTLLIYVILIATVRIMGKRQIGELEVTDLVTTLMLSEIAALPITDTNIPVSHALIPMITLLFLEVASSVILIRIPFLKSMVSAHPTILICDGHLDQAALRSIRISMEELMGEIRQQGYSSVDQINDAILEKNGKFTILPKPQYAQPTAKQFGLKSEEDPLMHVVFSDGKCNCSGLAIIQKDPDWIYRQLHTKGYTEDQIFCVLANRLGDTNIILLESDKQRRKQSK